LTTMILASHPSDPSRKVLPVSPNGRQTTDLTVRVNRQARNFNRQVPKSFF